jgi:outer membrane protein assembly factor BamE (lipoprotein component of BamABCDE complex)
MRKTTLLVLIALTLAFICQTGCAKSIRFTEDEIKNFPPNIQENIRKGQIDVGMTQEQARYAWGSPDSITFLQPYDGKSREEWIYSQPATLGVVGTKILLFYDGKLIYVR